MAKDSKAICKSLEMVNFGDDKLRQLVLNDCSSQYGELNMDKKLTFSASVNSKKVSFGEKETARGKFQYTPALHLLALCVQFDAILNTACNEGMRIGKIDIDDFPTTVVKWVCERREFLRKNTIVEQTPAVA